LSGGRTWWAHFEFTRINIEPIILRKKIEELREAHSVWARSVLWRSQMRFMGIADEGAKLARRCDGHAG